MFRKYTALDGALKRNHDGGGNSLTVSTGGPADSIWTGIRTHHDATPLLKLQENIRNRHRRKSREDDGALQLRGTPCLIDQKIGKGERLCEIRREDRC